MNRDYKCLGLHLLLKFFKIDGDLWQYATKIVKGKEISAQCKKCPTIIKFSGGSRTAFLRHLKNKHGIDLKQQNEAEDAQDVSEGQPVTKKAKTIASYLVPKQNLAEIVSEMAINGISIFAITRTKFIRDSVAARGFKLPSSENSVMKLVHNDYEDKKARLIQEIHLRKEKSLKFSMTIDEYLSTRRHRYFSINLHAGPADADMNLGVFDIRISRN